jgi:hypothetical protein
MLEWTRKIVLPYLEERYPDEVARLLGWIERHGGVRLSLETAADDPTDVMAHGILAEAPANRRALLTKSDLLHIRERMGEAEALVRQLIDAEPDDPRGLGPAHADPQRPAGLGGAGRVRHPFRRARR